MVQPMKQERLGVWDHLSKYLIREINGQTHENMTDVLTKETFLKIVAAQPFDRQPIEAIRNAMF